MCDEWKPTYSPRSPSDRRRFLETSVGFLRFGFGGADPDGRLTSFVGFYRLTTTLFFGGATHAPRNVYAQAEGAGVYFRLTLFLLLIVARET